MPERYAQWRALDAGERRLLALLVLALPMIGAAIRVLGFVRTYRLLGVAAPPPPGDGRVDAERHARAARIGRLVRIASSRGAYRATCLRQSLALAWLLRRRGLHAEVRLGVGRHHNRLRAHAWVALGGRVLNDRPGVAEEFAAYEGLDRCLARTLRAT